MKIGIDCHAVGSGIGGNENYAFHLIHALAAVDTRNDYRLYVTKRSPVVDSLEAGPNFRVVRITPHSPYVRIPVSLPLELRRHPVDVLLVQYLPPLFTTIPIVNMVHDLSALRLPEFFRRNEVWRNRLLLPWAVKRSARVLTVSQYSKDEIVETFSIPAARVVVTYPGVSDHFRAIAESERNPVLRRYAIATPYLLFVGNIQPRKNLRGVVEAFARLKGREAIPHRLVVVGRKAWLHSDSFAAVREQHLEAEVLFTGYVPYGDLPALYSGAAALIFPSFFEGFGSPPVEAMRCGTPVIVSNRPAFPEILGDAAMIVDPDSPEDIARGVRTVLCDAALRRTLIERGEERVRRYVWEGTARQTLAVLDEVVRGP